MQMPANPAIFPGTGEGLLVEAITVPQSCGKTRSFFCRGRVFSLRALLQYVWDIQTNTHTNNISWEDMVEL